MFKQIVGVSVLTIGVVASLAGQASADEPTTAVAAPAAATPAPVAPEASSPAPVPAEAPAPKSHDTVETGHFGLVGAVTNDGFQSGLTRVGEHYEAVLTADASFAALKSSSGVSGATGDLGLTMRAGPRISLGSLNYLALGAQGHRIFFGKDNGVSTAGSFTVGPYVGLERRFAGTPLMISLWVLPYQFSHEYLADGGKQVTIDTHQFFQGGGFGLTYLL